MTTVASTAYRRFFARPEALMLAALAAGAVILLAAAVIGGRQAQGSTSRLAAGEAPGAGDLVDYGDLVEGPAVGPEQTSGATGPRRASGGPVAPGGAQIIEETGERVSEVGATREGVHADHFEFGVHAPMTLGGTVPLNLAEDPIVGFKGYLTYINRNGGINGLKARLFLTDDEYTTQGGTRAATYLVNEVKPFFISGTLGIDQIAKVAKASREAKPQIPYMAGGGPEPEFKDVGMYQILANYDQYLDMVVEFICRYGPEYVGVPNADGIRLGTTTLNSEHILPVTDRFIQKISDRGCIHEFDTKAKTKIDKPTEQTQYQAQMIDLRTAYANQGANLIIPLQDPVTTSRQTLEWCGSYCPKWTIANFAHDGDVALALFQGKWTGMRVMSGACYYHPQGGGDPYNEGKCAKMGEAHRQWLDLGQVTFDENAGGDVGGHGSYNYQEGDANSEGWVRDGSGGAAGYQLVYVWEGAMRAIGADPTREKFVAALNAYSNYSNLITGPLTFAGSDNTMRGPTKFVLLEGQQNLKYRQVVEITPGLVDHF